MKEFGENWDDAPVRQPILFEFVLHYSYDGTQSDMLMGLMSEAKGVERSLEGWTRRLLGLEFASIHTTSIVSCSARHFSRHHFIVTYSNYSLTQTFTQTLYRLLAHPEYIEPLRQEVESVVAKEGWTRAGMEQMHKIDSFVRETQRLDGPMISPSNSFPLSAAYLLTLTFLAINSSVYSGIESSCLTSLHIFQRGDHPSRHTLRDSDPFRSYGRRIIPECSRI